jgi:hypothetical protein
LDIDSERISCRVVPRSRSPVVKIVVTAIVILQSNELNFIVG